MDTLFLTQLSLSILAVVLAFFASIILNVCARRIQRKKLLAESRYYLIRKIISIFSFVICVIALILIWGVDIRNLWLSFTSILAMIAIAFFAVWSLIGNMLAGVIVFFTSPFKIDDTIEIVPDEVGGKVLAINTFFTLLRDDDGNYISVPNSLFFQKYIKKVIHPVTKKDVEPE